MIIYKSNSVNDTEQFAIELAKKLKRGDIIAYRGGLGAGKTAFTRGLAIGLSLKCEVSSPTFSLVHEYRDGDIPFFHFDMYRINDINDLYSTGYFDYLDENGIIAVEWSENIDGILEGEVIYVTLENTGENSRTITVDGGERF